MNSNEKAKQFLSSYRPSAAAFDEWVVDASVSDIRSLIMQSQVDTDFTLYLDPAKTAIQEKLAKQAEITADKNLRTAEDALQISRDTLAAHHSVVALTWALLILTAVLVVVTLLLAWIAHTTDERLREIHQQYQEDAAQKKREAATPTKVEGGEGAVTQ